MNHVRVWAVSLMSVFMLWGCVEPGAERDGDDGEVCFQDTDCRDPLVCLRGLCQPEESYLYSCELICGYFSECGIQNRNECLLDCQESFDQISVQRANDFGRCVFAQNCEELSLSSARECGL